MKTGFIISPYNNIPKKFQPHIGISYIMSYLRSKSIFCDAYDFSNIDKKECKSIIIKYSLGQYDIIGFTSYDENINTVIIMAEELKRLNKDLIIIIGGPFATYNVKFLLEEYKFIDYIILGEGEITAYNLIDSLIKSRNVRNLEGIGFRYKTDVIINVKHNVINDLDRLPFPYVNFIKEGAYDQNFYKGKKAISIVSSRGCPFNCSFCGAITVGKEWRGRSPENIIQEILYFQKVNKTVYKHVYFVDAFFFFQPDRAIEIAKQLYLFNKNISFSFASRIEYIIKYEYILKELKLLGCASVELGVENANNEMLSLYNKGITSDQILKAIKILTNENISIELDYILFNPSSTIETIRDNLNFILNNNLMSIGNYDMIFSNLLLLTGTYLREYYMNIFKKQWRPIDTLDYSKLFLNLNVMKVFNTMIYLKNKYMDIIIDTLNEIDDSLFDTDDYKYALKKFLYIKILHYPYKYFKVLLDLTENDNLGNSVIDNFKRINSIIDIDINTLLLIKNKLV